MIDHTLLKANATRSEIAKLCDEARQYRFWSVCVNSTNVGQCADLLRGSDVLVCAVVGFPLGAMSPAAKAYEAQEAVRAGAREVDMVMNIGALKSRDYGLVAEDIRAVVAASAPAIVKVILETSQLSAEEKAIACALSKVSGAHFVKTSTGFGGGGATPEDIALMRRVVGPDMGVKASGGVRTRGDAVAARTAGANRIGASSSVAIVTGRADGGAKGY
jgi:deoxyribose-phosphate aldolase